MSRQPYQHPSASGRLPPILPHQSSSAVPPPPQLRSHYPSDRRYTSTHQDYTYIPPEDQRGYRPTSGGPSQTGRYHSQHDQPSILRSHPPATNPSALTSHVFAFRPPANGSRQYSTPSAPSSFARSSISPTKESYFPYPQPDHRPQQAEPSRPRPVIPARVQQPKEEPEEDEDASSLEEEDDATEKQKLESKREKNRLKQRNLRLRRANHVSTLETALETLESRNELLKQQHEEVLRREAGLDAYIASLKGLLQQHGLESELAKLKTDPRLIEDAPRGQQREREEEDTLDEDVTKSTKRRKVISPPNKVAPSLPKHRGSVEVERTSDGFALPHRRSDPGPSVSRPTSSSGPTPLDNTIRPRRSTSSFSPLIIDSSQTSPYLTAPSPRSIRIEDLLSPSFTHEDAAVPLSAFTIDTPTPLAPTPYTEVDPSRIPRQLRGGVEMKSENSKDSMDTRSGAVSAVDGGLDIESPGYMRLNPSTPGSRSTPQTPGTIGPKPIHPSVYTARILLRALLANQTNIPISHCVLLPLTPSQQMILLNAIYNLTTPALRDEINLVQARNLPNMLMKRILDYANLPDADLRVVLMPIAILRARVIGFLEEKLPFDITAFISHVLADGRIFGDTADPDAWEMSGLFWDVWGGWFKAGRAYCTSMSGWRRREGHTGANVIEILLGLEGSHSRMEGMIGKPEGWQKVKVVPPDKTMTEEVRISSP